MPQENKRTDRLVSKRCDDSSSWYSLVLSVDSQTEGKGFKLKLETALCAFFRVRDKNDSSITRTDSFHKVDFDGLNKKLSDGLSVDEIQQALDGFTTVLDFRTNNSDTLDLIKGVTPIINAIGKVYQHVIASAGCRSDSWFTWQIHPYAQAALMVLTIPLEVIHSFVRKINAYTTTDTEETASV